MHPFPQAAELTFLNGMELVQICIGQWQIQFIFDSVHIAVEGALEHIGEDGTIRHHNTEDSRFSPIFLHHLIGQKIGGVEIEPFQLTLTFDGGEKLRILSDEGPYECGQIFDKRGMHIVF